MLLAASIKKNQGVTAENAHHGVHPAVVIQVSECRSPCSERNIASKIGPLEPAVVVKRQQERFQVVQRGVDLLHVVQDVTLGNEQILPTVVVKILETSTPSGAARRKSSKTGFQTVIGKLTVSVVVEEGVYLPGQYGYQDVRPAIVVVILKDGAH